MKDNLQLRADLEEKIWDLDLFSNISLKQMT